MVQLLWELSCFKESVFSLFSLCKFFLVLSKDGSEKVIV